MPHSRSLAMIVLFLLSGVGSAAAQQAGETVPQSLSANPAHDRPEILVEEVGDGLSLEAALERLRAANYELATKYQDIPKARADILSASLIENPSVFLNAGGVPYGNYSPQRPGEIEYEVTAVQPFDVSGKRRGRIQVAQRAERVLEALYQDAVRKKIDELGDVFIDVLEARLTVKSTEAALTWLTSLTETMRELAGRGDRNRSDVAAASVRQAQTLIAREQAETQLDQARQRLALLLALPAEKATELRLRGSLRDQHPAPPEIDALIEAALRTRPDLAAHQLSVERALADVRLTRAERFEDILVFYTPYQATAFPSQNEKTATGWESGSLVALPIFDRKQGDLARARVNVEQLRILTQGLHRAIIHEVGQAATEYAESREVVQRYEQEVLPRARQLRDAKYRQFAAGQAELDALLGLEKEYQSAVDRYVRALARHRRSMLRLNTAVGQRILP